MAVLPKVGISYTLPQQTVVEKSSIFSHWQHVRRNHLRKLLLVHSFGTSTSPKKIVSRIAKIRIQTAADLQILGMICTHEFLIVVINCGGRNGLSVPSKWGPRRLIANFRKLQIRKMNVLSQLN